MPLLLLALPAVGQAQFNYATNNGTITITGYTGPGGAVTIPNTINGLPVTSIGETAFYGCTGLTSVTIPDSVTSIHPSAFYRCVFKDVLFNESRTRLVLFPRTRTGSYTIPDSVTSIGEGAFSECTGLTSVTIPNNVTSIGSWAFLGCTGLTSVTIPDSVTSIGELAFRSCTSLTSVTIGNNVPKIADSAFSECTGLTSVTIPNGVTSIGNGAFAFCTGLTSVTIPDSVTRIAGGTETLCGPMPPFPCFPYWGGAFFWCENLTAVCFEGNAPLFTGAGAEGAFGYAGPTLYHLPGTTGWAPTLDGVPTALWVRPDPVILDLGLGFGVSTNGFGFVVSWATNATVVVEACTNLAQPVWSPVGTFPLTGGTATFTDPDWAQYPARFYRVRSP